MSIIIYVFFLNLKTVLINLNKIYYEYNKKYYGKENETVVGKSPYSSTLEII